MDELKIVTTYKSSKNNKKLLDFISNNLSRSIDNNFMYTFAIAYNEDSDYYEKKGITTFPCISYQQKQISGADRVISFIQQLLTKRITEKNNQPVGEMMHDFFKESLGNKKDIEQEGDETSANPDDMGRNFVSQVQEELERRNLKSEHLQNFRGKNAPAPDQLPPSQRKKAVQELQVSVSKRKDNVEAELPIGDAMKNLKPGSNQEAADDNLMANFFANQMTSD